MLVSITVFIDFCDFIIRNIYEMYKLQSSLYLLLPYGCSKFTSPFNTIQKQTNKNKNFRLAFPWLFESIPFNYSSVLETLNISTISRDAVSANANFTSIGQLATFAIRNSPSLAPRKNYEAKAKKLSGEKINIEWPERIREKISVAH